MTDATRKTFKDFAHKILEHADSKDADTQSLAEMCVQFGRLMSPDDNRIEHKAEQQAEVPAIA